MPNTIIELLQDAGITLVTDAESLIFYGRDYTSYQEPAPLAVTLPQTNQQVQDIVNIARQHGLALVPSGGRTGLSGGAVAAHGELVVAFDKMYKIYNYDPVDQIVHCQAGVVMANLQAYAQQKNMLYPVDYASSGSAQIGGSVATNGGGIKVIRYGMTRNWIAGLTVVTGQGELLRLNHGLTKNATGYDLRHLFIGSEGTLGLITEVMVRLTQPAVLTQVMVLGIQHFADVVKVLAVAKRVLKLTAFEFFCQASLQRVTEHHHLQKPFDTPSAYYALLEFDCADEQQEAEALGCFESCLTEGWVQDGVISNSETQAASLWQLRELISETIAKEQPYKNDIAVRVSCLPGFIAEIEQVVSAHYPEFQLIWFGHIGDGNMHLNLLKPTGWTQKDFELSCNQLTHHVYRLVQKYHGSISAEHGIGSVKKTFLNYSRSQHEILLMRQIKKVLDPDGIMNPGKIFPADLADA